VIYSRFLCHLLVIEIIYIGEGRYMNFEKWKSGKFLPHKLLLSHSNITICDQHCRFHVYFVKIVLEKSLHKCHCSYTTSVSNFWNYLPRAKLKLYAAIPIIFSSVNKYLQSLRVHQITRNFVAKIYTCV